VTPGEIGSSTALVVFVLVALKLLLPRLGDWLHQYFLIFRAIRAARVVQDTLWGSVSNGWRPNADVDAWVDVLEKRIKCLRGRDESRRNWQVDTRKRALQVAAVAIAMLEWMDTPGAKNGQT
jgi:hypothetical protein